MTNVKIADIHLLPPQIQEAIYGMHNGETAMIRNNYYTRLLGIRESLDKTIAEHERKNNIRYNNTPSKR